MEQHLIVESRLNLNVSSILNFCLILKLNSNLIVDCNLYLSLNLNSLNLELDFEFEFRIEFQISSRMNALYEVDFECHFSYVH